MKSPFEPRSLFIALLILAVAGSALAQETAPESPQLKVRAIIKISLGDITEFPFLDRSLSSEQLETYIKDRCALLKSDFVIKAALAPRDIAKLQVVPDTSGKVAWLQKSLDVYNPPGTSLLILTLESWGDVKELESVLDSVIRACKTEIFAEEAISSAERIRTAEAYFKELEEELAQLIERQQTIADEDKGPGDSTEMRMIRIKIAVLEALVEDTYRALRYEKMRTTIGYMPMWVVQYPIVVPEQ